MKERIERKLQAEFAPTNLKVIDESHLHQGHSGWREGGETHFRVQIESATFNGTTRLARHRAINETLKSELAEGVHALAIQANAVQSGESPS